MAMSAILAESAYASHMREKGDNGGNAPVTPLFFTAQSAVPLEINVQLILSCTFIL